MEFNDNFDSIGDFDLFLKLSENKKIGYMHDMLAVYRLHNDNLSKNFSKLLTNKLFEWTGKKWVISFTNDINEKFSSKQKNLEDIKGSEVYTSVMESFPDAKFLNKQNINEDD